MFTRPSQADYETQNRYHSTIAASPIASVYGKGICFACHKSWNQVTPHITAYSPIESCFVLCEYCFDSMSIRKRLACYEQLLEGWRITQEILGPGASRPYAITAPLVRKAVRSSL